jgi:hypothetical protein
MAQAEMYFRTYLTEDEHDAVEHMIENFCLKNDLRLQYYRKVKTGHIPMIREVKVISEGGSLGKLKKYLKDENIEPLTKDESENIR